MRTNFKNDNFLQKSKNYIDKSLQRKFVKHRSQIHIFCALLELSGHDLLDVP